jgi:SNF2 family DNA or RNA helicase
MMDFYSNKYEFFDWINKHGCNQNDWGYYVFQGNEKHLKKIHKQIYPNKGHRVSIKELGDKFPDTQISAESYTMDNANKIQAIYKKMEKQLLTLKDKSVNDSNSYLTYLLRARQQVELLKVPTLIEIAENAIEEGNSVVIFVNFTETLKALAERLDTKSVVYGEQTDSERETIVNNFQIDNSRIIILNIKAGGVGISLHDLNGNYPRLSLICPTYSAQDMKQSLGRVHRSGGKTKSIQKIIYAANTIEEKVCEKMKAKLNNIDLLNDGDLQ